MITTVPPPTFHRSRIITSGFIRTATISCSPSRRRRPVCPPGRGTFSPKRGTVSATRWNFLGARAARGRTSWGLGGRVTKREGHFPKFCFILLNDDQAGRIRSGSGHWVEKEARLLFMWRILMIVIVMGRGMKGVGVVVGSGWRGVWDCRVIMYCRTNHQN